MIRSAAIAVLVAVVALCACAARTSRGEMCATWIFGQARGGTPRYLRRYAHGDFVSSR
jgi:hypothetical protein